MAVELVGLMFEFGGLVRPYLRSEQERLAKMYALDERELGIIEFIARKGPVPFSDVVGYTQFGRVAGASSSAISKVLSRLETGLKIIVKKPHPRDRRVPIVSLTKKGQVIATRAAAVRQRVYEDIYGAMAPNRSEEAALVRVFRRGRDVFLRLRIV